MNQQPQYPGHGYPPQYVQPPQPPQVGSAPLAPYRLGSFFAAAWHNIAKNPGAAIGMPTLLTLGAYILMMLTMGGLIWLDGGNNFALLRELTGESIPKDDIAGYVQNLVWLIFAVSTIAMVPMVMISVLTQAVLVPVSARDLLGLRTRFGQTWRLIRPVLGTLLLLGLIYSAAMAVVMFLIFGSLLLVMQQALTRPLDVSSPEEILASAMAYFFFFLVIWALVIISMLFLSVFLLVRFAFVTSAIVVEGLGPIAAIRRSWTLIRGRYWPVIGTFLLFTLIVTTLSQVFSLLLAIPTSTLEARQEQLTTESPEFVTVVVGLVLLYGFQVALAALLSVYQALAYNNMYFDLRFRKEGLHLELVNAAFNDPVLQAAAAGEAQAVELTKDYLPGQLRRTGLESR